MKARFWMAGVAGLVAAGFAVTAPAAADGLPGMKGMDHVGVTVPDMEEALDFFVNVIGCEKAMSFGPFRDDEGTFMTDLVNVHPRAVIDEIALVRCGNGSNIELFQYQAPDQASEPPKNSDIGGHHIAFYVADIDAAAAYLREQGVRTMMGPVPIEEGPAAGQSIMYFLAPWGLQLEAISYPQGMAYESEGGPVLWSPRDQE